MKNNKNLFSFLAFSFKKKFLGNLEKTDGSILIVPKLETYSKDKTYIVVEKNPRELMPIILNFFKREVKFPTKNIEDSVSIGENVKIAPNVYIGHDAKIGDNVTLHPGVYIGQEVIIGDGSIIYPNAVVREFCELGRECILQPGAIIGSDGFGYTKVDGNNIKIEQRIYYQDMPLLYSVYYNEYEIVKTMLKYMKDVNIVDEHGKNALFYVDTTSMFDLLIKNGLKCISSDDNKFFIEEYYKYDKKLYNYVKENYPKIFNECKILKYSKKFNI